MWTHEASIETTAAPERIWNLFADVPNWKQWNAGIQAIHIHGAFETGTTFTMQPPGQDGIDTTLIEVKANELFVDETVVDETRVVVSHKLISLPSGKTEIVYRTEITGPGAAEFGPMVTADFEDVLARLKQVAEQM
jgi:hypothetical protein